MAERYCQVVLVRLEELMGVAAISFVGPCEGHNGHNGSSQRGSKNVLERVKQCV